MGKMEQDKILGTHLALGAYFSQQNPLIAPACMVGGVLHGQTQ